MLVGLLEKMAEGNITGYFSSARRHQQLNKEDRLLAINPDLSELGVYQAERLAERLLMTMSRRYCSQWLRTIHTAEILADHIASH